MKQGHFIKLFFFLDVVAKRKQKILIQPDKPNVYKRRIYFLNKNKMDFHFSILLPRKKKEGNKKIWVRVKSHFLDVLLLDIQQNVRSRATPSENVGYYKKIPSRVKFLGGDRARRNLQKSRNNWANKPHRIQSPNACFPTLIQRICSKFLLSLQRVGHS